MTDDLYCQRCAKQLPIGVNYNRKYCHSCQVSHNKEAQHEKYLLRKADAVASGTFHKKNVCMVCKSEFLYDRQVRGRGRKICYDCADKFIAKIINLKCLLCGKAIEWRHSGRGRFAFCSVEHSKPAWYILRRYKKGALAK